MPARKQEILSLSGNLDIRQADAMQKQLKKAKDGKSNLTVNFEEAEDIDFAVIQLLYSFKKAMNEENRKVVLNSVNEKIAAKIKLCDFQDLLEVE